MLYFNFYITSKSSKGDFLHLPIYQMHAAKAPIHRGLGCKNTTIICTQYLIKISYSYTLAESFYYILGCPKISIKKFNNIGT